MIRKYNLKETLSLPSLSLYISLSNVFFQCSEQKTRNRIHVLCTSELFQVQAIDSYRLSVSISLHTRVGCKHCCFGWFRQQITTLMIQTIMIHHFLCHLKSSNDRFNNLIKTTIGGFHSSFSKSCDVVRKWDILLTTQRSISAEFPSRCTGGCRTVCLLSHRLWRGDMRRYRIHR